MAIDFGKVILILFYLPNFYLGQASHCTLKSVHYILHLNLYLYLNM